MSSLICAFQTYWFVLSYFVIIIPMLNLYDLLELYTTIKTFEVDNFKK